MAPSPSPAIRQVTSGRALRAVEAPVHRTAAAPRRHPQVAAAAVLIRLRLPLPRAGAGCASCRLFRASQLLQTLQRSSPLQLPPAGSTEDSVYFHSVWPAFRMNAPAYLSALSVQAVASALQGSLCNSCHAVHLIHMVHPPPSSQLLIKHQEPVHLAQSFKALKHQPPLVSYKGSPLLKRFRTS